MNPVPGERKNNKNKLNEEEKPIRKTHPINYLRFNQHQVKSSSIQVELGFFFFCRKLIERTKLVSESDRQAGGQKKTRNRAK